MTTKDLDNSEPNKQTGDRPASKKAYRAPSFRVERVFETTALICGKIQVVQQSCATNRKLS
jgi:hypothetical protein